MPPADAKPARLLRWLVGAIALHSLLLGTLLLLRPMLILDLSDWPYEGTRFFPAQSGIFLLILGAVYAAAVRNSAYLWIIVLSKGLAVLFLSAELLLGSCPRIVVLQLVMDGLMGVSVLALAWGRGGIFGAAQSAVLTPSGK